MDALHRVMLMLVPRGGLDWCRLSLMPPFIFMFAACSEDDTCNETTPEEVEVQLEVSDETDAINKVSACLCYIGVLYL